MLQPVAGPPQGRFGLLQVRDIDARPGQVRPAARIGDVPLGTQPTDRPVRPYYPELGGEAAAAGSCLVELGSHPRSVVRVDPAEEVRDRPGAFDGFQPQQPVQVGVPDVAVGREVPCPDPHPGRRQRQPESLLALAQGGLGSLWSLSAGPLALGTDISLDLARMR